jgi:hypothetical protein
MKYGVRVGGLVLTLVGWAAPVLAQEPLPKPEVVGQPAAPAAARPPAPPTGATSPKPAAPADAAAKPAAAQPAAGAALPGGVIPPYGPTCPGCEPLLGEPDVKRPRFYFIGEYLLWWFKQDKVPVLVTTSTNPFDNGILGRPTTQVLFGGDGIGGDARSGFRFTAGYWFDCCCDCCCKEEGIEFRGFYFAPHSTNFNVNSSEFPLIARPFFNANQQIEFAELAAFPGLFNGSVSVHSQSNLWGAEINPRCNLCCACNYRLDLFGGFRFLQLNESLRISEALTGTSAAPAPFTNSVAFETDSFGTRNNFYGGQVGLYGEYDRGPFSVETRAQLALGDTNQEIVINGFEQLTLANGTTRVSPAGLLALPSNSGRFHRNRFSVVPELEIDFGYQVTNHVRAFIGYDILYWSNVARPGGQIDRVLNINEIPNFATSPIAGPSRPSAPRDSTDFWAQGVTFGLEVRF